MPADASPSPGLRAGGAGLYLSFGDAAARITRFAGEGEDHEAGAHDVIGLIAQRFVRGPIVPPLIGLAALLPVAGEPAASSSPVHLSAVRDSGSARIIAKNRATYPVTVTLELTEQRNVNSDRVVPLVATIPAGDERTLLSLNQDDPTTPWSYRYRWSWADGATRESDEATADDEPSAAPSGYLLPYAPGFAFQVLPGQDDDPSHASPHAVDWLMPAGTQVRAARGGAVADEGGGDRALRILHYDGTIASYRGLEGTRLRLGDPVEAGDTLGVVAGAREFASPYLHFHVTGVAADGTGEIVPLTFATREDPHATLEPRKVYMRAHEATRRSGNGDVPLNAIRSLVTCRRVDRSGHPLDQTTRFSAAEVVHVHVGIGAPDIYPIRVEFVRAGETEPESIRRFPTRPEWDGVEVTLDLAGVPKPKGDWVVRALIGDEEVARTKFQVGD